jgi:hypothetical protein
LDIAYKLVFSAIVVYILEGIKRSNSAKGSEALGAGASCQILVKVRTYQHTLRFVASSRESGGGEGRSRAVLFSTSRDAWQ